MAVGSTLGSPKAAIVIKATGAIEKFYSIDAGKALFGSLVLHHWDAETGLPLAPMPGEFVIHPEHQEHRFQLLDGVSVRENIFVLSTMPQGDCVDPPAAYYSVTLRNDSDRHITVATYASLELRGETERDVSVSYDRKRRAFIVWNASAPELARAFSCSAAPASYEATRSYGKASARRFPGVLSCRTVRNAHDPIAIFHLRHRLPPQASKTFSFTLVASVRGTRRLRRALDGLPPYGRALKLTMEHYDAVLGRAVVITPDRNVNRGVLWSKANMLRVQLFGATGWCFVNDPTRSNNSVARDTAWFAFGSDYITPAFSRASLQAYVDRLERSGMVVEYYDIRTGETEDYGLNINDNTPLLILALWHHYNTTGDEAFLRSVYPAALKAARYILSQRNDDGLVWCTATGHADWGIVGWRNVIANYRLSGATTEVNSECYAALRTISHMARKLNLGKDSEEFAGYADTLKAAINEKLLDRSTGLYYLAIDLDGEPRTDVTSDLIFPVMFDVADDDTSANIISHLSAPEFWSTAGIHTVPRNAINYGPTHGYGLLGGVWVGVTFWYAFGAAKFNPEFMGYALSTSFRHYSVNPRQNNTVPGQFSEWLHGETLANQGMMLSPWFPPRYLWAALEGAAGLDLSGAEPMICPRLSTTWKWLGVRKVQFRGRDLSWFAVQAPGLRLYLSRKLNDTMECETYERDVSDRIQITGEDAVGMAFAARNRLVLFVGNTAEYSVPTAVSVDLDLTGRYAAREFNSLRGAWVDGEVFEARQLRRGIALEVAYGGFVVLELRRQT